MPEHFKWCHAFYFQTNTNIGYLYLFCQRCRDLVGHNRHSVRKSMGDKKIIRNLKKSIYSSLFIMLTGYPGTHLTECRKHSTIRFYEKARSSIPCPDRKIVITGIDFVSHFFNAENLSLCVFLNQPIPEGRTEIKPVMEIFCLNENIRVKKVGH